jgi:hypothetical protein
LATAGVGATVQVEPLVKSRIPNAPGRCEGST